MNKLILIKTKKNKSIAKKMIACILLIVVIFVTGFCGYFFTARLKKNKDFTPVVISKTNEKYNLHIRYPYIKKKEYLEKINKKLKKEINTLKEKENKNKILEYNLDYKIYNANFLCSIVFTEHKLIEKEQYETKQKVIYYNTFTNSFLSLEDILLNENAKVNLDKIIKSEYLRAYKEELKKEYIVYLDNEGIKANSNKKEILITYDKLKDILKKQYILETSVICKYNYVRDKKDEKEEYRDIEMFKNKKVICLTFDDGPSKYTAELIEDLNKRDAKATFFVLGSRIKGYEATLSKMSENGFQIGNHSFTHRNYHNLTDNEVISEIEDTNKEINKVTGITPNIVRSPYGNKKMEILKEKKLVEISWSIDPEDWKYRDVDHIVKHCLEKAESGDIILMHDIYKTSTKAAVKIVDELKKQGYEFLTISEMIKLKEYEINYENSIRNFKN